MSAGNTRLERNNNTAQHGLLVRYNVDMSKFREIYRRVLLLHNFTSPYQIHPHTEVEKTDLHE